MSKERIIAYPTKGKFSGKQIEVEFGESAETTNVYVNGQLLKGVQFVGVKCRTGQLTKIVIEGYDLK